MKKTFISKLKYVGMTFAATVIACVSLCANVNAATTIKYDPQMTDDELKKAITECNNVTEHVNEGGYYRDVRVQGIENKNCIDSIVGSNSFMIRTTDWGDDFVDTRLASFGYFKPHPGKKIVRIYDDELWNYSASSRVAGCWDEENNPYEYYTERYLENGTLYVRSRTTGKGIPMDVLETDGVDVSRKIDYVEYLREFDPETLKARKNIECVKYADENEIIPYMCNTVEFCTEFPRKEKYDQLYNDVFGGETHTIKLIAKIGTEDEREYSIAANKDSYLDYWVRSSDRSYNTYVDPECTIPAEVDEKGLVKFDSDKVLYMK